MTQEQKAVRFQALHRRAGAFLIPNPWDAGSARVLAGLGFEALATSSGAAAGVRGRRDGQLSREEALLGARAIVQATDLPVSADLENGFGDSPAAAAETVRLAAEAGMVGCSIEDWTGDRNQPLYRMELATERVSRREFCARPTRPGGGDQAIAGL
jgi:2-methylisocitrate lyase-like PEP mutase family enzyme